MKVLIAEDDQISRLMLGGMLAEWGYQTTAVADGQQAWDRLRQDDAPRLAVLDWVMPGLDGVEVCRRLRASRPARGADLSQADLSGAILRHSTFRDANLTGADLAGADLAFADATDALVEEALVSADTVIFQFRGTPKPPRMLRQGDDLLPLEGEAARAVFCPPAVVEVWVTGRLTQEGLGVYHFHVGEMHHGGVGTGIFLVSHRSEAGGSVLRFQAPSYAEIYEVLPDLLAPFLQSQAIDWDKTLAQVPPERREGVTTALIRSVRGDRRRRSLAERMYEVFAGFRSARVGRIGEGTAQMIRLEVFSSEEVSRRLSARYPALTESRPVVQITAGDGAMIHTGEGTMSKQEFHGGTFQGCQSATATAWRTTSGLPRGTGRRR